MARAASKALQAGIVVWLVPGGPRIVAVADAAVLALRRLLVVLGPDVDAGPQFHVPPGEQRWVSGVEPGRATSFGGLGRVQPRPQAQVHVDCPIAKRGAQDPVPNLGGEAEEERLALLISCPRLAVGVLERREGGRGRLFVFFAPAQQSAEKAAHWGRGLGGEEEQMELSCRIVCDAEGWFLCRGVPRKTTLNTGFRCLCHGAFHRGTRVCGTVCATTVWERELPGE